MIKYIDSKLGGFTTYYQATDMSTESFIVVIQETNVQEKTRTLSDSYDSKTYTVLCICSDQYTDSYDYAYSVFNALGDVYDDVYNAKHIISMLTEEPINLGLNKNNRYEYAISVNINYEVS